MTVNRIYFDEAELEDFCDRHQVAKLSLFGSILTDRFGPNSDVDVLVVFKKGQQVSLFYLGGMLMELRELLGRDVDLRTPEDLSPYFREDVLNKSRPLYAV